MRFDKKKWNKVMEAVDKVNESTRNEKTKTESVKPVDEWIWVEGYKGTDKDMRCRDYQYTLGELHTMPNEADIKECENGFHLCKKLKDVFEYYDVIDGHKFFKVRALVRKSDYERYGEETEEYKKYQESRHHGIFVSHYWGKCWYDKMVARSIIFEEELTVDEILNAYKRGSDELTGEYRTHALQVGVSVARDKMMFEELVKLGYSEQFTRMIIATKKYDIAKSVGSQPELSMDMKCWLIFKE